MRIMSASNFLLTLVFMFIFFMHFISTIYYGFFIYFFTNRVILLKPLANYLVINAQN